MMEYTLCLSLIISLRYTPRGGTQGQKEVSNFSLRTLVNI